MENNKQNTALLVMDMQTQILQRLPETAQLLSNVSKVIAHARDNKIPVIYVTVGFRQGAPEINMNNKAFAASKDRWTTASVEEWMKIEPAVAPVPGDIIVIKRRVSAFTGSDLEVVLRSQEIQHIILTGVATSGVVLSTVREAADKDYRITVLTDGCADADEEVHRVLTTKVFSRQADVVTVEEWSKIVAS
jgi:nicotinamidase-related amidase